MGRRGRRRARRAGRRAVRARARVAAAPAAHRAVAARARAARPSHRCVGRAGRYRHAHAVPARLRRSDRACGEPADRERLVPPRGATPLADRRDPMPRARREEDVDAVVAIAREPHARRTRRRDGAQRPVAPVGARARAGDAARAARARPARRPIRAGVRGARPRACCARERRGRPRARARDSPRSPRPPGQLDAALRSCAACSTSCATWRSTRRPDQPRRAGPALRLASSDSRSSSACRLADNRGQGGALAELAALPSLEVLDLSHTRWYCLAAGARHPCTGRRCVACLATRPGVQRR